MNNICDEIRIVGKIPKMREMIKMLPNGLIICDIKIFNTFINDETYVCNALIDTGCQNSIICESIFKEFKIDGAKIKKRGLLTVNNLEKDTIFYPFSIAVPSRNWSPYCGMIGVINLLDRKDYKAIIGIDILKDFRLYCDWVKGEAWLEV